MYTNVNPLRFLELPKDEKELQERKMNEKADKIQSMDEHKIPL